MIRFPERSQLQSFMVPYIDHQHEQAACMDAWGYVFDSQIVTGPDAGGVYTVTTTWVRRRTWNSPRARPPIATVGPPPKDQAT